MTSTQYGLDEHLINDISIPKTDSFTYIHLDNTVNCNEKGSLHEAKNHQIATRVSKISTQTSLICPCCYNPINNETIPVLSGMNQTYHLGIAYHLYFHFIIMSIIILASMLITIIIVNWLGENYWYLLLINGIIILILLTYFNAYEEISRQNFACISNFTLYIEYLDMTKRKEQDIIDYFQNISARSDCKIGNFCFIYDLQELIKLQNQFQLNNQQRLTIDNKYDGQLASTANYDKIINNIVIAAKQNYTKFAKPKHLFLTF